MPPEALPEAPPAALRLDIDRAALAENWRALDRLSGAARAGAAVKADAYGLGARRVAAVLREAGCGDFFVAHWREAADLLDVVEAGTISVLHGPLTGAESAFAIATGVKPVINSLEQTRRWLDAGGGRCVGRIDTGMNRLGIPRAAKGASAESVRFNSWRASAMSPADRNVRPQQSGRDPVAGLGKCTR